MRTKRLSRVYSPELGDFVIGMIVGIRGDKYIIDICTKRCATLSIKELKKQNLVKGTLVHGKIIFGGSEMEISSTRFDDKPAALGRTGLSFCIPITLAQRLLSSSYEPAFKTYYSKTEPFELSIGLNGILWVNGIDPFSFQDFYKTVVSLGRKRSLISTRPGTSSF
jgi:exosome complex RNA-binding protein Rrp4